MVLRASRRLLAKKIDKLLWIHVLHKINDMFRYWYFFCFSVLPKYNWRFSLPESI